MGLSRLFCCFGASSEEIGTPRSDRQFQAEVAGDTPSAASCSTPVGPKFVFDKDERDRVTGLNNSGMSSIKSMFFRSDTRDSSIF